MNQPYNYGPWQPPAFRFYVVVIHVNPGLTINDVQRVLREVPWYRVSNNVWVLHTMYDHKWIFSQLSPLVKPSGTMFISRLDPAEREGWMAQEFWDWFVERIPLGV